MTLPTRLFTFASMKTILNQSGYEILEIKGIPAPFPKALRSRLLEMGLVKLNDILIKLSKALFAYQMYFKAVPLPTVDNLLKETISYSKGKKAKCEQYIYASELIKRNNNRAPLPGINQGMLAVYFEF